VKLPPPCFTPRGKKSPSAASNHKAGAARSVWGGDGADGPPGSCPDGEVQASPPQEAAIELLATAMASRCVGSAAGSDRDLARDPPSLCSSPRHAEVTLWGGNAAGTSQSLPASHQPGGWAGQLCPLQPGTLFPRAPRVSRGMRRQSGAAEAADGRAAAAWAPPERGWDTCPVARGRAESVSWQQLEPLPPADSVSAPLGV